MAGVHAVAPDGKFWLVRIIWRPRWWPLVTRFGGWRSKPPDTDDPFEGVGEVASDAAFGPADPRYRNDDDGTRFLIIIGMVLGGALIWWVVLPVLLAVVDAVVIVVQLTVAIPARILLGRPWTIEAVRRYASEGDHPFTTDVIGWRQALRTRDEIVAKIGIEQPGLVFEELHRR
jgi:hypothetical protein